MIVLGLDTTGSACACALVNNGNVLAQKSEMIGRGHAERLAPMVHQLLQEARHKVSDIDQIAVCTGPGSFTGLRVALAFAKGLALPQKTPLIGLSALEVFAAQQDPLQNKDMTVFTDVKRGEVCLQRFNSGLAIGAAQTLKRDDADLCGATEISGSISVPIMAWLSIGKHPDDFPAAPLYSRPPDAKLPGGLTPS